MRDNTYNADLMSVVALRTHFCETRIRIQEITIKAKRLNLLYAEQRLFRLGLNGLCSLLLTRFNFNPNMDK